MSLKEQFYKYLTGTKTPDPQRLKESAIIAIIIFIIGSLIGVGIQLTITKLFLEKADAELTLGTFDKDEIGYYFPLKITNSGQKNLQQVYVNFKNCHMTNARENIIVKLPQSDSEVIKLRDNKSLSLYISRPCDQDILFSMKSCRVRSYKLNSTHIYVPIQNCSIFMCDFCEYSVTIRSLEPKFIRQFNGSFYGPKEIILKIRPNHQVLLSNQTPIREMYPIGLNFFSDQELCVWDGTCFAHNFKTGPYLPNLPIEFTICPTENLTCMNITIEYESIPPFSRYT